MARFIGLKEMAKPKAEEVKAEKAEAVEVKAEPKKATKKK